MRSTFRAENDAPSLHGVLGVWLLFGVVAAAIVVTYSRLPPEDLYNVSEGGVAGGFGRALVFLNYPLSFVAVALVGLVAARAERRAIDGLAFVAAALCLVTAAPGVVEQSDLDAAPENAIPAVGVALALGLTAFVARTDGLGSPARRMPLDGARVALAAVLVLASVPWIAAELGFYAGLGGLLMSDEVIPEPGDPQIRAVHLGEHHGFDGVLLALTALVLSRQLHRVRRPNLRRALTGAVSLIFVYGLANAVQDFWLEQLVKRGTSSLRLPNMTRPELAPEWLGIVLAAAGLYALLARSAPPDRIP